MVGLTAPLCRRTGVEQALPVEALLVDGDVAVTEDDDAGIGEPPAEPAGPTGTGSAVMDHADAGTVELQEASGRQRPDEADVIVAEHGVDGRDRRQAREHAFVEDVAGVQDDIGLVEDPVQRLRQATPTARAQVGVGQHDRPDAHSGLPDADG